MTLTYRSSCHQLAIVPFIKHNKVALGHLFCHVKVVCIRNDVAREMEVNLALLRLPLLLQVSVLQLDETLVHRMSFMTVFKALKCIFVRVYKARFILHSDKCYFMQREVKFLGKRGRGLDYDSEQDTMKDWFLSRELVGLKMLSRLWLMLKIC